MSKQDISKLLLVVDFGFALGKVGVDVFQGGKFHPEKLGEVFDVVPTVLPAFEGLAEVPAELADLDADEIAALVAHLASKGVLPAKAEAVLEKSLQAAYAAYQLIEAIRG